MISRMIWRTLLGAIACVAVFGATASAQWLKLQIPGTPRNPDGTPNLRAPEPRGPDGKPDLSGVWHARDGRHINNLATAEGVTAPFQPWAAALFKERQENNGIDRPSGKCLPKGVPEGMTLPPYPFKIVQTPKVTLVLYEIFVNYRQIHTDGRSLPTERHPAWFGYSVGRWEDETFVVETVGINDRTWLDDAGHPHSDALRITERMRRIDFGRMDIEFTFDDPKAYTKPWTVKVAFELMPDTELLEYVCENEKDLPHIVGK
jgi:hypothetical protein